MTPDVTPLDRARIDVMTALEPLRVFERLTDAPPPMRDSAFVACEHFLTLYPDLAEAAGQPCDEEVVTMLTTVFEQLAEAGAADAAAEVVDSEVPTDEPADA